ncbi:UDP-Glycosyltransferase/glycogen phosphorylase [Rickenella mellea]|uniref:Sterol 3-beta-glucosyltransferase n=1 Tax=Rickenella mellea TaxID=50990 RepID=A0A4Y7QNM8_9AGAM|nr:UDP-Glycosyltransferase/glycogen phosphorylase [Rickenella mellea]
MSRTASLATVRLKRRAKLAEKLKDIFGLSAIEEVVAELPCWLLRSILLQGYMYLTNSHLCFFAHMPAREDQVLKSGSLNKKTQRTKRWVKHWFVLKNDVLSWYQSSSDPYFPHGVIDLRYAISCETVQEKGFRIRTNQKVVTLMADSAPSREEWVKAVRKVIFKAQNLGDSVKIAIPYTVITDVEKSSAMDFSETIEVKVSEKDDASTDSYFFAYFHNISLALDQIRDAVRTYKPTMHIPGAFEEVVHDTTTHKVLSPGSERAMVPPSIDSHRSSYSSKLASLLRFSSDSAAAHPTGVRTAPDSTNPSRSALSPSLSGTSLPPTSISVNDVGTIRPSDSYHTYPPAPSPVNISPVQSRESVISSWSVPVPSWLKVPSKRVFASPFSPSSSATEQGVQEVVSPLTPSLAFPSNNAGNASTELGYSVLETKDAAEPEMIEKFRTAFAFDEKEPLLGYFPGYLFRLLPTPGRLYVSTNFFCFKSSGPLATRTRMILPIRDILALENSKAYRFGHQGLVIIIKGHEELFFEFSSLERRSAFFNLLQRQLEEVRSRPVTGEVLKISEEKRDALVLEELEPSSILSDEDPRPPPETLTDSLPAVMFTSKSSTFLTFKPQKSLRFTFLTIGTRGDVQPYIALAKGLIADGHSCKIATHGEFKDWIESHGIEFGYVGGDPAELMRLCVENGMFTVSFLKEGVQKFRSWIDDLLKTAWEACQGTDVLIESPVAMGGIHIAEALKIPYFRAFTMTWTRTRAYPHAFAVPERKMGGGYNYMTYVMFDQVFWRGTAGQINRWRKHMLGLSSTSLDKLEPHKVPFLYNFSPTVVPPPLDWPEWIRVTGYWFLDDADGGSKKTWSPPDGIVEFIDKAHNAGRKVVYIGFGSIVVSDPDAMTRCVVEAIVKSGVHAILSKGWSDRLHVKKSADVFEPEIPLPPQIFPIQSIPHDWLFKRIDAACHHGGAGTTGASLRAGIPTIIKPFFGDQFFWADRVEALGIGSGVRKLTVDNLTEALAYATTDAKQIARAKLVGEQIRSENGVATAVEAIYRDLEYARSLIKPGRSDDSSTSDEDVKSPHEKQRKRRSSQSTPDRLHSSDSNHGAPSEDWSVISDQESSRFSASLDRSPSSKRNSLAAAVMSVLPTSKSRNATP